MSIGSNDLMQYLMAADRDNPKVAHLCEPFSPALLRLLNHVIRACNEHNKPVTLCGEMAGRARCFLPLFGMGLRRLSMSPAFLPPIREVLRYTTRAVACEAAQAVLGMATVSEVPHLPDREGARYLAEHEIAGFARVIGDSSGQSHPIRRLPERGTELALFPSGTVEAAQTSRLRLAISPPPAGAVMIYWPPDRPPRAPRHVLLIEDNPDGRESLRLLLSLLGYEVEVAADGAEGLRKGLEMHPDVAIVDIGLPKLDGYQVGQRLRQALGRSVTLVAYTAYDEDAADRRAAEAGFDAWLVKPVELSVLTTWLDKGDEPA